MLSLMYLKVGDRKNMLLNSFLFVLQVSRLIDDFEQPPSSALCPKH